MKTEPFDPESTINSKVACKLADTILEKWGCSKAQRLVILNIDSERYEQLLANDANQSLNNEQLKRMSYLANIHAALKSMFSNPDNVYGFMSMHNNNGDFNGEAPLSLLCTGDIDQLRYVAQHVTSMMDRQPKL